MSAGVLSASLDHSPQHGSYFHSSALIVELEGSCRGGNQGLPLQIITGNCPIKGVPREGRARLLSNSQSPRSGIDLVRSGLDLRQLTVTFLRCVALRYVRRQATICCPHSLALMAIHRSAVIVNIGLVDGAWIFWCFPQSHLQGEPSAGVTTKKTPSTEEAARPLPPPAAATTPRHCSPACCGTQTSICIMAAQPLSALLLGERTSAWKGGGGEVILNPDPAFPISQPPFSLPSSSAFHPKSPPCYVAACLMQGLLSEALHQSPSLGPPPASLLPFQPQRAPLLPCVCRDCLARPLSPR